MQIFEFHFNPKNKEGLIFDSFCYEPENIYERKMGGLYMAGVLKNALPKNQQFLEKLSKFIKARFYRIAFSAPERALKECLKTANEFLEQITKRGDVSWLGNLGFAVLSLKDFKLNFTKVGEIKILLFRAGRLIDIDKKLKFQEIEPYPLRVFGNIVSGKLAENDLIMVLTKETLDFFQAQNLFEKIAKLNQFSGQELKNLLDEKKEGLAKISGICVAIILKKETIFKKETISPQEKKDFSLKEIFSPVLKLIRKLRAGKSKEPQTKNKVWPFIKISGLRDLTEFLKKKVSYFVLNTKLIWLLIFIFVLILGFFFSQAEENKKIMSYEQDLNEAESKLNAAESFLILETSQSKEKANSLLKESWALVSPLIKEGKGLPKTLSLQILSLRDELSEKLSKLNKLEKIEEPELFFEFKLAEFVPQKVIYSNDELYFFSPYSKNLFKLEKEAKGELLVIDRKFNSATAIEKATLFFSKPNQLTILKEGQFFSFSLEIPQPDFEGEEDKSSSLPSLSLRESSVFDDFSSFNGNLYFLDKNFCQIVKYPYFGGLKWAPPEIWLKNKLPAENCSALKALAVDGSVWILNKNSISRYYAGNLQEEISPDIFPSVKEFSKIFTSPALGVNSYLYILEPSQKRLIILDKKGEIIKQFQSEKFDNLLDFAISENGKTIWLLNGLKVYKIEM